VASAATRVEAAAETEVRRRDGKGARVGTASFGVVNTHGSTPKRSESTSRSARDQARSPRYLGETPCHVIPKAWARSRCDRPRDPASALTFVAVTWTTDVRERVSRGWA